MSSTTLAAEAIVQIWERGRQEHPVDRALTILGVLSGRPRLELAELSVEQRDRLLLDVRSRLFGAELAGYAECPTCACGVDVSLVSPVPDGLEDERFELDRDSGGPPLVVRMPTSLDLAAIAACESVDEARRLLVRRCIEGVPDNDGLLDDEGLLAAVELELDRRAGVSAGIVTATCPDCGRELELELDVAAFAWCEIEIKAARLLHDVDVLAQRYGWSEREILALSPARRAFYLELAR